MGRSPGNQAGCQRGRHARRGAPVAAIVAIVLILVAAPAAVAAPTTTIGFDDLPAGTLITNQYDAQGVDFFADPLADKPYCSPYTIVASGDAQSGDQVADTTCSISVDDVEISAILAELKRSAQHVSLYAGYHPTFTYTGTPPQNVVTVTAYDLSGDVVATTSATLVAGEGTHTLLSIASAAANIASVDVTADHPHMQIDDLTFDAPVGATPDFGIHPQSSDVPVIQGAQATDPIVVQRVNGSTGPVSFSASGLPAGVHASFTPNPASAGATTMTLTADLGSKPPSGPDPTFTVTATPGGAGAGPAPRSAKVAVGVQPLVSFENLPDQLAVPPCSTLHVPITLSQQPGFTGDVTLSVSGLPADDQATLTPATLTLPGQQTASLDITGQSDVSGPSGNVTVTATGQGFTDQSVSVPITRTRPSITSVTDSGGAPISGGRTPQGTSPGEGTIVIVHGQGFCPGSTVYFGNAQAPADTQGPVDDGLGYYGDEKAIRAYVPSLGTSGQLYVVGPGETVSSTYAKAPFTVDSYRNTGGFAFNNSQAFQNQVGGYNLGDVSDVFGNEQTHISINPCFPLEDCSYTTPVPDPFAYVFTEIADASLQGGQCFGFSLASQRLLHGDQSLGAFPLQAGAGARTVWNLQGPDTGTPGASPPLTRYIHLMHLEQFSKEGLLFWLERASHNAVFGTQDSLLDNVDAALKVGDHPLIEMRYGGEGHVVVAYEIDQTNGSAIAGTGDRVIDVYDPNAEFTSNESPIDGTAHAQQMATSEIIVHPNGHWEFQDFSPEWHGGPGSLIVMPYSTVPLNPTLPTSGAKQLLISESFGSASATQVTDARGHTLLGRDGALNSRRKTVIPDATQFAPLTGSTKPDAEIFLFGHPGAYTTSVRGRTSGDYHETFLGTNTAVVLTAATHAGVRDAIEVAPGGDGVAFGTTSGAGGSRPATAQVVVDGTPGSERTATVAMSVPASGQAGISFNSAHDAVELTAGGAPTTAQLTLSGAGRDGLPQTFTAPAIALAAGDRATFTPARWSTLQSGAVTVAIVHAHGATTRRTLTNRAHTPGRYSVAVTVKQAGAARRLTAAARFGRLAHGSSAIFVWQVLAGHTLVAHHSVVVTGKALHRGLVRRSFLFRRRGSARYTARVLVELIAPGRSHTYLSRRVMGVARF